MVSLYTGDILSHPHATSRVNYRVIPRIRQGAQRLVTELGLFCLLWPRLRSVTAYGPLVSWQESSGQALPPLLTTEAS